MRAAMSIAENMALRNFDRAPLSTGLWFRHRAMVGQAERWIAEFNVKTQGADAPVATLSGGNVQRAVLARELSEPVSVLIAANPVFGLVAEIQDRILAARGRAAGERGSRRAAGAVGPGRRDVRKAAWLHETATATADTAVIGRWMAGHGGSEATTTEGATTERKP
jgi:general nucleoside transport system ATP-binding protein